MLPKIIMTADGSHTIEKAGGITYHSVHGAIQESMHIYIKDGLRRLLSSATAEGVHGIPEGGPLHIFEMGMGTGLNVLLTWLETRGAAKDGELAVGVPLPVHYETIEAFPLDMALTAAINYPERLGRPELASLFSEIHSCTWGQPVRLDPGFILEKHRADLQTYRLRERADLVYFDAFAPEDQPELWRQPIFEGLFKQMKPGGLFLTYCSKGAVRRGLQAAGFLVEKLPGPRGKREIIRAQRP